MIGPDRNGMQPEDPGERIAQRRLSVLQLADVLGNVCEACRRSGIDRKRFYEWRHRFEVQGIEGLRDHPQPHSRHPQATPPEIVQTILKLSLEHPGWGCGRLAGALRSSGRSVSSPTVQHVLCRHGLGRTHERSQKLEELAASGKRRLSAEQIAAIERSDPAFRDRDLGATSPGQILLQDTLYLGECNGPGKLYLHHALDAYCALAFGLLGGSKGARGAVALLRSRILPFYKTRGIRVAAVWTDHGREFCGTAGHPYERCAAKHRVEHCIGCGAGEEGRGVLERFAAHFNRDFFHPRVGTAFRGSWDSLHESLETWLRDYNQSPLAGWPDMGEPPLHRVEAWQRRRSPARGHAGPS
jgi:hypothetical protein